MTGVMRMEQDKWIQIMMQTKWGDTNSCSNNNEEQNHEQKPIESEVGLINKTPYEQKAARREQSSNTTYTPMDGVKEKQNHNARETDAGNQNAKRKGIGHELKIISVHGRKSHREGIRVMVWS